MGEKIKWSTKFFKFTEEIEYFDRDLNNKTHVNAVRMYIQAQSQFFQYLTSVFSFIHCTVLPGELSNLIGTPSDSVTVPRWQPVLHTYSNTGYQLLKTQCTGHFISSRFAKVRDSHVN